MKNKIIGIIICMLVFASICGSATPFWISGKGENELWRNDDLNRKGESQCLYSYSFDDPDSELMIETGYGEYADGDIISYKSNFSGIPIAVTCSFINGLPLVSSPIELNLNGFKIGIRHHNNASASKALVRWIAIYPYEYKDPDSKLMIEANSGIHGWNEWVYFNKSFPAVPTIIGCGQKDGYPVMAGPVKKHYPETKFLWFIWDYDDQKLNNVQTYWIAIYPKVYEVPNSTLKIHSGDKFGNSGDVIDFDGFFPTYPDIVTCAQSVHDGIISYPIGLTKNGFSMTLIGTNGEPLHGRWMTWLAIHPRSGKIRNELFDEESDWATFEVTIGRKSREVQQMLFYRLLEQFPILRHLLRL